MGLPQLVLANAPEYLRLAKEDIIHELGLVQLGGRFRVQEVSVQTGAGLGEAFEWINKQLEAP